MAFDEIPLTVSGSIDDQLGYLTKGTVDVIERPELRRKLERSGREGKPLLIKAGFDPTAPDIHLGHTVVIRKMRQFQQLGHRVAFLIGDFTGIIGDPSGKKSTRPELSRDQILRNAETYRRQIFKLLDPEKTEIVFNSEWLMKLGADGMVRLAGKYTVARILERDDFRKRYESHQPISLHELLYPIAQGYDSVALECDVELGGTDQLFNLLVGRDLMKEYGQEPQIVMTMPLLEGLDGVEKMSKSLDNYIGIDEEPGSIFGKTMSISDELMWKYQELCTDATPASIESLRAEVESGKRHPMEVKKALAHSIVRDFHGEAAADAALAEFTRVFSRGEKPEEIEEFVLDGSDEPLSIAKVLTASGLASSNTDARRLIAQGGVSIDDERFDDVRGTIDASPGKSYSFKVGKRRFGIIRFE
ncbi:MAG: tyrosine--tRNA ligase [Acidobacteria bacterium]|nr:tyrosine--tRNA ligase [Acidobacteriota bacterium]